MTITKTAVIRAADCPYRWQRKAIVELEGEQVGFWLENNDHPDLEPETEVQGAV